MILRKGDDGELPYLSLLRYYPVSLTGLRFCWQEWSNAISTLANMGMRCSRSRLEHAIRTPKVNSDRNVAAKMWPYRRDVVLMGLRDLFTSAGNVGCGSVSVDVMMCSVQMQPGKQPTCWRGGPAAMQAKTKEGQTNMG